MCHFITSSHSGHPDSKALDAVNVVIGCLGALVDVDSKRSVSWKGTLQRDSSECGEVLFIEAAYVPVRVILVCEQGFDGVRT